MKKILTSALLIAASVLVAASIGEYDKRISEITNNGTWVKYDGSAEVDSFYHSGLKRVVKEGDATYSLGFFLDQISSPFPGSAISEIVVECNSARAAMVMVKLYKDSMPSVTDVPFGTINFDGDDAVIFTMSKADKKYPILCD